MSIFEAAKTAVANRTSLEKAMSHYPWRTWPTMIWLSKRADRADAILFSILCHSSSISPDDIPDLEMADATGDGWTVRWKWPWE